MDNNLPLQIRLFNDKVRAMNQTNGKLLTLNLQEARGLHAEIYDLMATIAALTNSQSNTVSDVNISMDGGGFK
jgi:hypothetical protein